MWDADQLAELPVLLDRLQALGDPLGEWLAIRARLDAHDELDPDERRALRRAARALRDQLGPRLILAEDPRLGRPQAIRERGFLIDVSFPEASVERLLALLARPDAGLLLRLRLRGSGGALRGCVEALLEAPNRAPHLRELGLELREPTEVAGDLALASTRELALELGDRSAAIAVSLPQLFSLRVEPDPVALPFVLAQLEQPDAWSAVRRTTLGRALASREPDRRQRALERLREHGVAAIQLRSVLLSLLEAEPDPRVRAAVFGVIGKLGVHADALIAVAVDGARHRDDPQLQRWIASLRP